MQQVRTITAIDPADRNCGIVKYDVAEDRILRMCWLNMSADAKKTSTREMVQRFLTFAEAGDPDLFDSDRIVVEEQYFQPRSPAAWVGVRNMCLETSVMSRWRSKALSVSPTSVKNRFKHLFPRYRKKVYKNRYRQKKHDMSQVACALMSSSELLRLASITQTSGTKEDDILDAFLIAVETAEDLTGQDLVEKRIGRK